MTIERKIISSKLFERNSINKLVFINMKLGISSPVEESIKDNNINEKQYDIYSLNNNSF
jgi:hypothetical protein